METGYLASTITFIFKGAITTILIWAVTMLGSIPISILLSFLYPLKIKALNAILALYTSMIRGTPLLFQLFFVYFGLPILFDITLSSFLSAGITFINSWVAYITEIIRGGLESIDKGQFDAAKVLGFNYFQMMTRIIFPQVISRILPAITNQSIEIIYCTALLSTIGISDLLRNTKSLVIRDLNITPFLIAGIIYFMFNSLQISIFRRIEYKFNKYKYGNSKDPKDLKKI